MDIWVFVNPFLRTLLYFSCFGAIGTSLFLFHFGNLLGSQGIIYCNKLRSRSSLLGITISLATVFSIAGTLGGEIFSAFDVTMLELTFETKIGRSTFFCFVGFLLLFALSYLPKNLHLLLALSGAAIVLGSFTSVGHSSQKGLLVQGLLAVHLVGISFWLGSLLPFRWICDLANNDVLYKISQNYSILAMRYVGLLLIAGGFFAYYLFEDISQLFNTTYGNIFISKLTLVSMILSLGALNKFMFTPMLHANSKTGRRWLSRSIKAELFIAFSILLLSSILTTSIQLPFAM